MRILIVIFFVGWCHVLSAQIQVTSRSSPKHYYYEPLPMGPGELVMNLGLSLTLLPEQLVDQELPAPAIDFRMKHGLSDAFTLYASYATNYFTNVLAGGIAYNRGDKDFSYSINDGFIVFAGFFDAGGEFDKNSAAAVANVPSVHFGHRFGNSAISISLAATYILYAYTHVGSLEGNGLLHKINDINCTVAFEQPFFGNVRLSTGVNVTFSRTPYQIWMLYNEFDQYLMLPEFFFSFQL